MASNTDEHLEEERMEEDDDDDRDIFEPSPSKRIRRGSMPNIISQQADNIKIETPSESGDEDEDEEDEDDDSRPPSPRIKHRRECAEAAKKKIKLEQIKTEPCDPSDSREGSCDRNDCPLYKRCCLAIINDCYGSRTDASSKMFHHISKGEHVCFACYDDMWKSGRQFHSRYHEWKGKWSTESRCTPTLKLFIQDQILPYWLQCTDCGRFRNTGVASEANLTVPDIKEFRCGQCHEEEPDVAVSAREHNWIYSIAVPPLLHNSPALHYLKADYFSAELGMSPVEANHDNTDECASKSFMTPFNIPHQNSMAFCLRPDMMEYDEIRAFPEYSIEPVVYLPIRNLIITLWNMNPFKYLRCEDCIPHLICRGLARVWYLQELVRVYDYLNMKCMINYGVIEIPKDVILKEQRNQKKLDVVVIGAGISGLTAARQLRSMGANVTVLEAKNRYGGRMQDDWSLGVAVGCGAQLVTGTINNPIILMCEQLGVGYRPVADECPLVDAVIGQTVDHRVDRMVQEHFNCVLDALYYWKLHSKGPDASVMEHIDKVHKKLIKKSGIKWGSAEERVFQFQLGNVEFSCGTKLDNVSSRNWDQNEAVAQPAGAHALLTEGSGEIIRKLSEGTDVRLNHEVTNIDWGKSKKRIEVECKNGKIYQADKVLIAVPLAVLKKGDILQFTPSLPDKKKIALKHIGAGLIEKVAVRFPRRFWTSLLRENGTLDYFSHVPKDSKLRGLFNMFYDFSTRGSPSKNQHFVLMSYVCGDSVNIVNEMSDVEVVQLFVNTLKEMFPNEQIPDPTGHVVTHWGRDCHIGMSYSYIRIGGTGEHYDWLAESVQNKLYFSGEGTNRFVPQTMTGAYMSGLREAGRIIESHRNQTTSS